jgi:translocation and assembly module TamA
VKPGLGSACLGVCACVAALTLGAAPLWAQSAPFQSASGQPVATAPAAQAPADEADKAGTVPVPTPPPNAQLPQVEPVIGNDEFNAAIPPLKPDDDPELNKPLESIEQFEARTASEQAAAKSGETKGAAAGAPANPAPAPQSPAPAAASSVQGAPEHVGEAPIRDVELAKPLPPLDQFQVEPIQLGPAEKDQAKAPKIHYATRVNGLAPLAGQTEEDLSREFRGLSALRKGHGSADNVAMLSARLNEDGKLLKQILASQGWYSAIVETRIDQPAANVPDAQLTAVLDVTPGRRYSFSQIIINHDTTIPSDLIERNFAIKVGEPIIADRVQGAEAQISVALPANGYAFAKVGQRDILLDPDTGLGVLTLPVDVGPRGVFGSIQTRGKLAFDAHHVGVLARFRPGELYDSRKVDDLRKALVATGLFATVGVTPEHSGESTPDGSEYVDLMVDQKAGKPRTLSASTGYATGQGYSITGTWTHRNMWPPEGALILNATLGTDAQGFGATFRRSNAHKRDRTFEIVANALHANYDSYKAYTGALTVKLSRDSTPLWQKRFTWAVGGQLIATREQTYDFDVGSKQYHNYFIAGLIGQAGLDHSDSLLNPSRGWRLTALVLPTASFGKGSFTPYAKMQLDASGYYPIGQSVVLAGRLRFGTIQGAALDDLAPSQRFYAGGGGSVRGYAYQKLGPLDPNGDPIGGRSVNEGAAEVRYRFGNYGVVAFFDAGQAYTSTMPQFDHLRYGVGIGGRFYTNFGPLRLDIATPLDRRPNESKIAVYVSIGQAF